MRENLILSLIKGCIYCWTTSVCVCVSEYFRQVEDDLKKYLLRKTKTKNVKIRNPTREKKRGQINSIGREKGMRKTIDVVVAIILEYKSQEPTTFTARTHTHSNIDIDFKRVGVLLTEQQQQQRHVLLLLYISVCSFFFTSSSYISNLEQFSLEEVVFVVVYQY